MAVATSVPIGMLGAGLVPDEDDPPALPPALPELLPAQLPSAQATESEPAAGMPEVTTVPVCCGAPEVTTAAVEVGCCAQVPSTHSP